MSDFDSPWKDALDRWLPAFLAFFFSDIHADIDWARGYEMLDKELQQLAPQTDQGRRHVDKLAKVWLRDGSEAWVLIHVEIQSQPDPEFARRMYQYNTRLFDKYNREVVSVAALADERPDWRPTEYRRSRWGCTIVFEFRTSKLLDFADETALENDPNPFAVAVLAQRKTQQTRSDLDSRRAWKLRLVRGLYERKYAREDIVALFRFIDWVMDLPADLTQQFWQAMDAYEKEQQMPYLTSIERLAIERGREEGREIGVREGLLNGLALGLEQKFGARGKRLMARIRRIQDVAALTALQKVTWNATTLDEVRQALP